MTDYDAVRSERTSTITRVTMRAIPTDPQIRPLSVRVAERRRREQRRGRIYKFLTTLFVVAAFCLSALMMGITFAGFADLLEGGFFR